MRILAVALTSGVMCGVGFSLRMFSPASARIIYLTLCFLGLLTALFSEEQTHSALFSSESGINVDLVHPVYSDGVITTEHGGVIAGPSFRIQAMHIVLTRCQNTYTLVAEGQLQLEFGDYVFVGERLEYDFATHTGVIFNGRTMVEPWFFGGERIQLCADGSYLIHEGYVTTSTSIHPEWEIYAETASVNPEHTLCANNVQFRILKLPLFWIPKFTADLDLIFDSPIKYNVKWGSRQGHRFGLVYEIFSWNHWKTFLRLDYRLKRGLGGGIETKYCSPDHKSCFESVNYVARDSSIIHPGQRLRYRFQGIGRSWLLNDKISAYLSYDKLSDIDMPTDYNDRGLELDTAGRTELLLRRQEHYHITNFITRVRINAFQTIKQELPTFETCFHPFQLGPTGIVADTNIKASYLYFAYGNNMIDVHDYSSPRLEITPQLYRSFAIHLPRGFLNLVPNAGGVMIAYGNSPQHSAKWLVLGKLGCTLDTELSKYYGDNCKHLITPYLNYSYYTMPTVSPSEHYIFDIEDGWFHLNMLTFGCAHSLFHKDHSGNISRRLYADLFAHAFFNTPTIPKTIPKVYAKLAFNTFPFMKHIVNAGWDFDKNLLDHYNVRTEWTVNENIAIAAEYRHRSPFDWRKVDHTNFILDSYRTISQLEHSQLSDRRDTLLLHFFYRFHPSWAFEFESRSGWNRRFEPNYNEFEIDLLGTLRSAWNIKISYQHKEDDDRLSVYMTVGLKRPDFEKSCQIVPWLAF
jgi:hypothetical protein